MGLFVGVAGCSSDARSGFEVVAADDLGRDPFVESSAKPVPAGLVEISDQLDEAAEQAEGDGPGSRASADPAAVIEARQAAVIDVAEQAGLNVRAPMSRVGAGVYGGAGENVCDVVGMVNFFSENRLAARAWAGVHEIDRVDIPNYLETLVAGYLLDDYDVMNHRLVDGDAEPFDATLEAGTAVLVDDGGVPRARCLCGNPLLPRVFEYDGRSYAIEQWADAVSDFAIGDNVGGGRRNPENVTGVADYDDTLPEEGFAEFTYTSLGNAEEECEFFVTVEFLDNRLIDGPGADLRVFEIGSTYVGGATEPFSVWVEEEGDFIRIGEGGDVAEFDLAGTVSNPIQRVRICDLAGNRTGRPWPGADLDAVAAINSIAP